MAGTPALKKGLNDRQLRMIAIGGVIGAGLFVGSGVVIRSTGPGSFIAYALCGFLVIMVMRMLAEMAVANPSTGSFADYARDALGGWAGFSVGWLYWYFWVIIVGFEAIATAGTPRRVTPTNCNGASRRAASTNSIRDAVYMPELRQLSTAVNTTAFMTWSA